MAEEYRSSVDPYGFERSEDFDYSTYDEFIANYLSVLARRAKKWEHILGQTKLVKKGTKVKRYCRKGIPREHRGLVWMTISGAEEEQEKTPNLYKKLLDGPKNQDVLDTIKIDIPRTFPDNIYFKHSVDAEGKRIPLYNILVAFAHENPAIGYCQGLNFIAGVLLLITEDEETTFWLLNLLASRILPDYYAKEMLGLLTDMEVMAELVRQKVPQVYQHLKNHNVAWPLVVSKWFICLFAEVLPIETVLRIWDCLFYEGSKILFRVSVTLILLNREKILAAGNFAEILDVFKGITQDSQVTDCHTFMQAIFKEPGSFPMTLISRLRSHCRQNVQKQQEEHKEQVKEQQKLVEQQRLQRIEQQKQKAAEEQAEKERKLEDERLAQEKEGEESLIAEQNLYRESPHQENLPTNSVLGETHISPTTSEKKIELTQNGTSSNSPQAISKEVKDTLTTKIQSVTIE